MTILSGMLDPEASYTANALSSVAIHKHKVHFGKGMIDIEFMKPVRRNDEVI